MALPKVVYNAGAGDVTLQFVRGPQGFVPEWLPVVHDNVSSSGAARERVEERKDILISFAMPAHVVGGDLAGWMDFMGWALSGGLFKFYPDAGNGEWYTCVDELARWTPQRVAVGVYSAAYQWRILLDAQAPASPGAVMARLLGL